MWDLRTLAQLQGCEVFRVIPKLYRWVYKILRLSQLLVELWVPSHGYSQLAASQSVVITAVPNYGHPILNFIGSGFSIPAL